MKHMHSGTGSLKPDASLQYFVLYACIMFSCGIDAYSYYNILKIIKSDFIFSKSAILFYIVLLLQERDTYS